MTLFLLNISRTNRKYVTLCLLCNGDENILFLITYVRQCLPLLIFLISFLDWVHVCKMQLSAHAWINHSSR